MTSEPKIYLTLRAEWRTFGDLARLFATLEARAFGMKTTRPAYREMIDTIRWEDL